MQATYPRALFLIASLQMWEAFSYYGMRSILILYLTSTLLFTDDQAYSLFAVYISLVEVGGIFGGFLADKYFGAKKSLYIGASIMVGGHLCMLAIPYSSYFLYIALSLIAVGSALFSVNCATMVGELYEKDDPTLQSGYTLYYCALNVGAFLSTVLCGLVASSYGWAYGFSLAGFGMLIGLCVFIRGRKLLENKGLYKKDKKNKHQYGIYAVVLTFPLTLVIMTYAHISIHVLPAIILILVAWITIRSILRNNHQKRNILTIVGATLLLSLFYACEELIGTSLVLFADRLIDRQFLGFMIPSSSLMSINPITIIVVGWYLSKYLATHLESNKEVAIRSFTFISFAFLMISFAFIILLIGNLTALILAFMIIASAELFIGPVVFSLCIKLSPEHTQGESMGVVMLGYSLSGLLSGYLGKYLMIDEAGTDTFHHGFTIISILTALVGLLILITVMIRRKQIIANKAAHN